MRNRWGGRRSSDSSSSSDVKKEEKWKQRPQGYFYRGLRLPSGRKVDVRYRNFYIRKGRDPKLGKGPLRTHSRLREVRPKTTARTYAYKQRGETDPFTMTLESTWDSPSTTSSTDSLFSASDEPTHGPSDETSAIHVADDDFLHRRASRLNGPAASVRRTQLSHPKTPVRRQKSNKRRFASPAAGQALRHRSGFLPPPRRRSVPGKIEYTVQGEDISPEEYNDQKLWSRAVKAHDLLFAKKKSADTTASPPGVTENGQRKNAKK
ncbi:hypothetical protein HPB48_021486 [Haemaphysalis longicornis]|uniref:Uncharacterized protein n=1 Tax=Haemaphysalis longicornis TaxID=44386 RepID=A0A9J6FZF5_HAELO|nr:hypothetical protein HPB48_021486 [Haemaphysalis longicornis]